MRHLRSPWQKRRSEFNHDWLKNQYLPALAKFLNLLDDLIEDREFESSFVPVTLSQWGSHREEALALASDYEQLMSPQRLFSCPPLSRRRAHDKQWLGRLVHDLWLARYPVRRWVSEALAAAESADVAYRQLQGALQSCADTQSAEALRPFRKQFLEFYERCQELGGAISKLPDEVKVV
ncbi:MAG TPA: hypothetical protein VF538_16995 [Pyrinomonadaceae bacterium]|jgi:hypothetical protein